MMTILVTGSNGFLGRNLCSVLAGLESVSLLRYDLQGTPQDLENALATADVIFHLAGINRPHDPREFETGNAGFTTQLCSKLVALGRAPKFILSSSIQATLDNPYGISKRQAEEAVREYGFRTGAEVAIYRLPNVFGKGCRPNYNSAVATFCHNIAHDIEIRVNDPDVEMNLVYIDDVVEEFMRALAGDPTRRGLFCDVPIVYDVKLGTIVELLYAFKSSRTDLQIPDQGDGFTRKLYATYVSYLPPDKFSYPLNMNIDGRGSFTEFLKTRERGQVSVNISKPNITRGNHWHHTKCEKFLVVSGRGVIRFRKPEDTTVQEYFVTSEKLEVVDIPPGYAHSIENLGETDLVTIMWASESFDPQKPDTIFERVRKD